MAGNSALFRCTNTGDNESNVSSSNKIEFNSGAVPDANGRLTSSSISISRDISMQPNPNRALSQIQDGKMGSVEVIVTGYIVDPSSSSIAINLYNWQKDPATNTDFPFGRFGIRLDDFPDIVNLTPSAVLGYILYDVFIERQEDFQRKAAFICKFYKNGTP